MMFIIKKWRHGSKGQLAPTFEPVRKCCFCQTIFFISTKFGAGDPHFGGN